MQKLLLVLIIIFFSCLVTANNKYDTTQQKISGEEINKVIKNVNYILENIYLYPNKAKYASQTLLTDLNTRRFQKGKNRADFKKYIRTILIKSTLDSSIDIIEERPLIRYVHGKPEFIKQPYIGVDTEISDNNIGFLRIKGDFYSEETHQLIYDALEFLSNTDAIIVDLRSAENASLALVQKLISYFVPSGTVIGNLVLNNEESDLISLNTVEHDKFKSLFPVYIINSAFVSGEWEFFSYSLQSLDKAIIVGQQSMGIGHLSKSIKVGNDIVLNFPYALITKPSSNETWDQTGVIPNYFSTNDESIQKAYDLALTQIAKH